MLQAWAKRPEDEYIALSYPDGFKEFNEHGEELFMVLTGNLYGDPEAGRRWGLQRDDKVLELFNNTNYHLYLLNLKVVGYIYIYL